MPGFLFLRREISPILPFTTKETTVPPNYISYCNDPTFVWIHTKLVMFLTNDFETTTLKHFERILTPHIEYNLSSIYCYQLMALPADTVRKYLTNVRPEQADKVSFCPFVLIRTYLPACKNVHHLTYCHVVQLLYF